MNPDIKRRWQEKVEALPHGFHWMHKDEKFCALGALCEVYREDHPEATWSPSPFCPAMEFRVPGWEWRVCSVPDAVLSWAGIEEEQARWLAEMNDDGVSIPGLLTAIDTIESH